MGKAQCLKISENGKHYVCINCGAGYRYLLYEKWFDRGWHQKKVAEFKDFGGVLTFLRLNVNWTK